MSGHRLDWERPWKGISYLVLREAGLTCENGLVFIPYRCPSGQVHNRRVVGANGRWWETAGLPLIPFGLETLPDPNMDHRGLALVILEGESDCLAFHEAFAEVVGDPVVRHYFAIALPGATTWRPDWREYVESFDRVYVIGDGDLSGRRMMDQVLLDVPWVRPVHLPAGRDARDILQADGADGLLPYLDHADRAVTAAAAFRRARTLDEFQFMLSGEVAGRAA